MLSLINSDIALLATEAGNSIDNMLYGNLFNPETTQRLASFLNNLIGAGPSGNRERPSLDNVTLDILTQTVREVVRPHPTIEGTLCDLERITVLLSDKNPRERDRSHMRAAGDFCHALSKSILTELNNRNAGSI